jgi:hypothetical protein
MQIVHLESLVMGETASQFKGLLGKGVDAGVTSIGVSSDVQGAIDIGDTLTFSSGESDEETVTVTGFGPIIIFTPALAHNHSIGVAVVVNDISVESEDSGAGNKLEHFGIVLPLYVACMFL